MTRFLDAMRNHVIARGPVSGDLPVDLSKAALARTHRENAAVALAGAAISGKRKPSKPICFTRP